MSNHFSNAKDAEECAILLQDINHLISTLYKLSNTKYNLDEIFNGHCDFEGALGKMGVDSAYFSNLALKFQTIRGIIFEASIDWDEIAENELNDY